VTARGGNATAGSPLLTILNSDDVEATPNGLFNSANSYADASVYAIAVGKYSNRLGNENDAIEGDDPAEPQVISGNYAASAFGGNAEANGIFSATANANAHADGLILSAVTSGEIDADISATAEGGDAESESQNSMFTKADASARADGVTGVAVMDATVAGTINATATGGTSDTTVGNGLALANSNADAVGINFYDGDDDKDDDYDNISETSLEDDVSAAITAVATGGNATTSQGFGLISNGDAIEGDLDDDYGARADAYAAGIDNVNYVYGEVSGAISATATGGRAQAFSQINKGMFTLDEIESEQSSNRQYASASAEAFGITDPEGDDMNYDAIEGDAISGGLDIYNEVSSDITAKATGGDALTSTFSGQDGEADAYAIATGIDGNVILKGERIMVEVESEEEGVRPTALSGSFTVEAKGGRAYVSRSGLRGIVIDPGSNPQEPDTIEANGGFGNLDVDAGADAYGVNGKVIGNVSADFDVTSVGGLAYVQTSSFNGPPSNNELLAYADSSGIYGGVYGDFSGEMTVNATGGTAVIQDQFLRFGDEDEIDSDTPLDEYTDADASAISQGIGDGDFGIDGDVTGPITVNATGGTIAVIYGNNLVWPADTIEGFESEGGISIPDSNYNVYGQAIAIYGSTYSDEISGALTATAVGGTVIFQGDGSNVDSPIESNGQEYPVSADALAAGIAGEQIIVDNISGGIYATATPGVIGFIESNSPTDVIDGEEEVVEDRFPTPIIPEFDNGYAANGFAFGLIASHSSEECEDGDVVEGFDEWIAPGAYVDVTISSEVHAIVLQPELPELPLDDIESGEEEKSKAHNSTYNAYAAAVYGGIENDFVYLAEGANIIGDINLNGGDNELTVMGDTIMLGDILSSSDGRVEDRLNIFNGSGTVDFDIDAGLFTAVGTVNVSDLADQIDIASAGGLAPLISRLEDEDGKSLSSVVNVFGDEADVVFAEGSTVRPTFNGMEDWSDIAEDERFLIVSSEGLIDMAGAIADGSLSPFEITLLKEDGSVMTTDEIEAIDLSSGENLFIVLGDVKTPGGGETPGGSQTVQATNTSSQAVMIDISKRASLMRSLLRGTVASAGEFPEGAAGPDADRMENGEWLSYISVFGNIGSQDNENGAVGFDYDTYGLVVGQEKLVGDALIVGVAGSFAQTDVEGNSGSGGGETDLYSGVVYGNWFTDTWYTEVGLTYGHAQTDTRRKDITNVTYTGDYDSNLYGTWVEVGYTTTYEGLEAEPYARVSYVYGDHEGFTDSGAGPNALKTKDTETQNFQTEIGIRLTEEWVFEDDSKFLLGFKAAWEHEWADQNVRLDAEYLGAKLSIDSPEADRAALVLGLRGEWRNADGLSIGLQYEPSIAGNWMNHAFSGTIQLNW